MHKMAKDYQTIVDEINDHLSKSGKRYYSDFYIGITNDVERRLFKEHNVAKEKTWWIYRTAKDSDIAREVEKHFWIWECEEMMEGVMKQAILFTAMPSVLQLLNNNLGCKNHGRTKYRISRG